MARPGISTKNTEKIPPGPEFWTPGKYPEKIPKKMQKRPFLVFFRYFFGVFFRFQNFRPGAIFSVFFVEIPHRAISGLCSRSGGFSILSQRYPRSTSAYSTIPSRKQLELLYPLPPSPLGCDRSMPCLGGGGSTIP